MSLIIPKEDVVGSTDPYSPDYEFWDTVASLNDSKLFGQQYNYLCLDEGFYQCMGLWGTMLKRFWRRWLLMEYRVPKMFVPKCFKPIFQDVSLDFRPLLENWYRKYRVSEVGIPFTVKRGYGFAVLVGLMAGWLLSRNHRKLCEARKKYNVPTPLIHSDSKEFLCYYRVHENGYNSFTPFIFLLLIGASEYPGLSSVGGLIWIAGRYVYANGFQSGDPDKRYSGSFYLIGSFILMYTALKAGVRKLTVWHNQRIPDFYVYRPNNVAVPSWSWVQKYIPEWMHYKPYYAK